MYEPKPGRPGEQGGARAKLIIFLVVAAALIYGGILYIPVALKAYQFKDAMQNKVDLAAVQGYDGNWLREQLVKSEAEYGVPVDAIITPANNAGRLEVRVQFNWPISLPGYTYQYQFDSTAKAATFLTTK